MNKKLIWLILNLPLIFFFGYIGLYPKEYHIVLILSGHIALILYLSLTSLNPSISAFPTFIFLKQINRYRSAMGVACFSYAFLHLFCYFLKTFSIKTTLLFAFFHPYVLPGTITLLIFLSMALTSNKFSIQKLGFIRWKKLHKLTYIAQFLIMVHVLLLGGPKTKLYLIPFVFLFYLQWRRRQKRLVSANIPDKLP